MYDERLAKIEEERKNAIAQSDSKYNNLLADNEKTYNLKNDLITQHEATQNDILDKQLKSYEDEVNKQKESALKNKETEERKARNDYMNYINPYGYQNENLIQNGLLNSGVYTKENLGAYTTYQNRLSTANKVLQDAYVQYDSQMNEARLNNDVQKAQNALARLEQQINFADTFYSNKSNLTLNQLKNTQDLSDSYYNRYQTEYNNIQNEKANQEAIRQWEAEMAFKKQQTAQDQANWEKQYALSKITTDAKVNSNVTLNDEGYSIVKENPDGWKLTNLYQKGYEVYENPDGDLLYWNKQTNRWEKYTGSAAKNTSSAKSTNENASRVMSVKPSALSYNGNKVLNSLASTISITDLQNKLATEYKNNTINDNDVKTILKAYGLK